MICINVVNTHPIITGKHDPTMSGKHRPAIDMYCPDCYQDRQAELQPIFNLAG